MRNNFDETDPSVRRLTEPQIQKALAKQGVASGSALDADLRRRIKIVSGYRGELLVRAVDDRRALLKPEVYLTQKRDGVVDPVPQRSTGPFRILKNDWELINASVEEIAAGRAVVVDAPV